MQLIVFLKSHPTISFVYNQTSVEKLQSYIYCVPRTRLNDRAATAAEGNQAVKKHVSWNRVSLSNCSSCHTLRYPTTSVS